MAIKKYKPVTPGQRGMTGYTFDEITKDTPERSLVLPLRRHGGRNSSGRLTVRHQGGGSHGEPEARHVRKRLRLERDLVRGEGGGAELVDREARLVEAVAVARGLQALAHLHDPLRLRRPDAQQAELRFEQRQHAQRADDGLAQRVAQVPAPLAVERQSESNLLHFEPPLSPRLAHALHQARACAALYSFSDVRFPLRAE